MIADTLRRKAAGNAPQEVGFILIPTRSDSSNLAGTTYFSDDGINWTSGVNNFPSLNVATSVKVPALWTGQNWVFQPYGDHVYTSPDGLTWTKRVVASGKERSKVWVWDGNVFSLVLSGSTSPYTLELYKSTDHGVTWSFASLVDTLLEYKGVYTTVIDSEGRIAVSYGRRSAVLYNASIGGAGSGVLTVKTGLQANQLYQNVAIDHQMLIAFSTSSSYSKVASPPDAAWGSTTPDYWRSANPAWCGIESSGKISFLWDYAYMMTSPNQIWNGGGTDPTAAPGDFVYENKYTIPGYSATQSQIGPTQIAEDGYIYVTYFGGSSKKWRLFKAETLGVYEVLSGDLNLDVMQPWQPLFGVKGGKY